MNLFWSMDPFEENQKYQKTALSFISSITQPDDTVTAAFLASPREPSLSLAFNVPENQRFDQYPKRVLNSRLKNLGAKKIKPAVFPVDSISGSEQIKTFSNQLVSAKADLLVLSTYARSTVPRLFLGSFVESMIHVAKTDLFIFSPAAKAPKKPLSRILYAYDMSKGGDVGLERVIKYAKHWNARLDLVHQPEPMYSLKFKGQDEEADTYRQKIASKKAQLEKRLAKDGLEGSVVIAGEWQSVTELIMKTARELKSDIIAVTAKASRWSALFGGSVTRQVVRESKLPTLVLKV